jgi:hypothetical protein
VIELALAAMQQRKAGWTRADLAAEINTALPDYLVCPTAPTWPGWSIR